MSKLENAYKNATLLKTNAKKRVNDERLFLNNQGIKAEKSFEDKTKYGYNKLQQYKPTAGDENNPIAKLIKSFEQMLQNGEPLLSKFSNFYLSKGDILHYIPRTILLFLSIFIIITEVILLLISPVIEAIPFIGPPLLKLLQFFSLPKELYFMFYGGIKFVLCFTILLSVIILIKEREQYFSASMKDILFLFIVFVINLLPYLYDLLSYIIHLGIMDGFYRYKCQRDSEDNEKVIANKFNLIALLEFGILLIGLISFLYYFLRHYFYPNATSETNGWYIDSLPLFMFFVPILYLGILYICNFIEKELSDMVLTNMSSMDEDIPDEKNCVAGPGQCEDSDDNKLTGLLKLFIYGGISFFIVILQRTSLSKAIRNVLEQTITTNIMLIQKIIGINIKVKVKNDEGKIEDFDVDTFEKNRNISDYSYGEEIRKKLFKIKETNQLPEDEKTQYTVEDCENISNLRDIYNNLKKQDKLYGENSPAPDEKKNTIIEDYTKEFKNKLNKISDKQIDDKENIFTNDIFAENQKFNYLIKNCNTRMKQLDPNSLLGANADFREKEREIANLENNKKIREANIKLRKKEFENLPPIVPGVYYNSINPQDLEMEIDKINSEIKDNNLALSDTTNGPEYRNGLKEKLKKLQINLAAAKNARDNQKIRSLKQSEESLREQIPNAQQKLIANAINFGNDKFKTDSAYNKIKRDAEKTAALYEDAKAKKIKSKRELAGLNDAFKKFEESENYNVNDSEKTIKKDGLQSAVARAKEEVVVAEEARKKAEEARAKAGARRGGAKLLHTIRNRADRERGE